MLIPTETAAARRLDRVRAGAVNWTVLLWALGVPIPLVLIIGLMRGCS